jgi:hypothetical protein
MENKDYQKMKTPDLKKEIDHRDIKCKMVREDMIKQLTLHDNEKYIYETVVEKNKSGSSNVGIDIHNTNELIEMGRLVEKGLAKRLGIFMAKRVWYEKFD